MAGEVLSALGGLFTGVWDRAYSYWRDQMADNRAERDFDYQKALQNQIFQREDNAVQRRMADLQAAGLNPNLAAGSSAGAGAVVGRSNTPTSNFHTGSGNPIGNALDMASHVAQLRNIKTQNEILQNQKQAQFYDNFNREIDSQMNAAYVYKMLGYDVYVKPNKFGLPKVYINDEDRGAKDLFDTPLGQQITYQIQNNKNSADLLQKDVDYYTSDKIFNYIGAGARAAGNLTGGIGNLGTAYYNFYKRR